MYYSHPFHPDRQPADPAAAAEVSYDNAKAGIRALILCYLGGCCCLSVPCCLAGLAWSVVIPLVVTLLS